MHCRTALAKGFAITCVGALAAMAMAQGQGQPAKPFVTHQIAPNVYWVEGGGGNSGVIIGDNGVSWSMPK
jgi:hypothetical protein